MRRKAFAVNKVSGMTLVLTLLLMLKSGNFLI